MSTHLRIGPHDTKALLDEPGNGHPKAVVVFLPGISGGATTDRFKPLVDACLDAGLAIARVDLWQNASDVESKTLTEISADLTSVIDHLSRGYNSPIVLVGKSFGGAIALVNSSHKITARVLWAPAIGAVGANANIDSYRDASLGTLNRLLDITIDGSFLQKIVSPTLIIHGTNDESVPITNSEKLVAMLPQGHLVSISGADHSYREPDHEVAVIGATINFLLAESESTQMN